MGAGGASGAGGTAGAVAACSGVGPPILLPTASGPTCAAALATRGHRFAVCACDDLNLGARLRTDAFDSTNSNVSDSVSAAVGTDGKLATTAELRAGGAIYVAGPGGVSADGHLQAGASFRSAGPLTMLSSNADLLADAYVNGDVTGTVNVGGTLLRPLDGDGGGRRAAAENDDHDRVGAAALRLRRRVRRRGGRDRDGDGRQR